MTIKNTYKVSEGFKGYLVEFLKVGQKTHRLWFEEIEGAGSKMEAYEMCKRFTKTCRVLAPNEVVSNLKELKNAYYVKSDRGCRVF